VTVGVWLEGRTPAAPDALRARIREALRDHWGDDASGTHRVCEAAAESLLASLLAGRETGRETALDLLAADALVTYAFEHAAESGDDLEAKATAVMQRIAGIGVRFAAPAAGG
jgi:hypothetical protein